MAVVVVIEQFLILTHRKNISFRVPKKSPFLNMKSKMLNVFVIFTKKMICTNDNSWSQQKCVLIKKKAEILRISPYSV